MRRRDFTALACERGLASIRMLLTEATSAHRELAIYDARLGEGDSPSKALQYVVDCVVAATYPAGQDTGSPGPSSA